MTPGIYFRVGKEYQPVESHVLIGMDSKGAFGKLKKTFENFINVNIRANIAGDHSGRMIKEIRPEFVFILDYPARSPEEFFLVKLNSQKNSREFNFQRASGLNSIIGVSDTVKIAFNNKKMEEGIYSVSITHPLRAGEYCFLYNSSTMYKASRYKVFDFSIGE